MNRVIIKLEKVRDNSLNLKKALELIVRDKVLVGVPEDKSRRRKGPLTNALLAYVHDKGSPANNIPARPFMEPGVLRAKQPIVERMEKVGKAALDGNARGVEAGLRAVGLIAQASIRARINEGIPPALKPRTLAARRRRGVTSTKSLVVTGQLRNAINFEVRKKPKNATP